MPEQEPNPQVTEELKELLRSVPDPSVPPSIDPAGAPAEVLCWGCGEFLSRRLATLDPGDMGFYCESCHRQKLLKRRRGTAASVIRNPFFYVCLISLLAACMYIFGIGQPCPEELTRLERDKPWYRQTGGKAWFQQAARTRTRALTLASRGESPEARSWASLSRNAFEQAAHSWQGTDAEPIVKIGAALMAARAGNLEQARSQLDEAGAELEPGHSVWTAFLFHRGRLALEAGETESGVRDWKQVLAVKTNLSTGKSMAAAIDQLLEAYSTDPLAAIMLQKVITVSGLNVDIPELQEQIHRESRRQPPEVSRALSDIDSREEPKEAESPAAEPRKKYRLRRRSF